MSQPSHRSVLQQTASRRTLLKQAAALGLAAAALPVVAGATTLSPRARLQSGSGGTVNLFLSSAPDTFLPQYTIGAYARYLGGLMFPRLLRYNVDATVIPYLAESYEASQDGLSYTFKLVPNAKWTDGQPVTAHDVAWTYTMALSKDYAGTRQIEAPIKGAKAYHDGTAQSVEGIEAIDDGTIRITLERPTASFVENVAQFFWILPSHVLKDTPIAELDKHPLGRKPDVTAGPLKFVSYETDQFVEFARDPNFFLGTPKIEKFIFKIMRNDVALAQFEKGELDATTPVGTMLPQDVSKLKKLDVDVVPVAGSALQSMSINNDKEYFKDRRIRQALAHAIDREAIIKSLLGGYGQVLNAQVPKFSPYYNPKTEGLLAYDPKQAKQLLKDGGWDFGREVTLTVPTGNVTRERSGPIIQQYLQAVGMKVKIETMDFASMQKKSNDGDVDLWLVGNSYVTFDPDVSSSFRSTSLPPTGWNSNRWNNPEADKAMDEGLAATTPEARKAAYDQLQMIMAEDVPCVFLYHPEEIHAVSHRLKNAKPVPVGIQWNIQEWELTK